MRDVKITKTNHSSQLQLQTPSINATAGRTALLFHHRTIIAGSNRLSVVSSFSLCSFRCKAVDVPLADVKYGCLVIQRRRDDQRRQCSSHRYGANNDSISSISTAVASEYFHCTSHDRIVIRLYRIQYHFTSSNMHSNTKNIIPYYFIQNININHHAIPQSRRMASSSPLSKFTP